MACADDNYMPSAKFQLETALKKGKVDKTLCFNIADMDEEFKTKNKRILEAGGERRKGCYLWKPYFVNKVIDDIQYGDYLIYLDSAGFYYKNNVSEIISYMKKHDIYMIGSRRFKYLEKHWTKRDAFVYIGCDTEEYTNQFQAMGGLFVLRKTEKSIALMKEWLYYAQDYRIITDAENTCGLDNYEGFVENRHDQSILSLLMKKYSIPIIDELPVADFFVYHHTMETSIRDIKKKLRKNRMEQIGNYIKNNDIKGIYYIERERLKGISFIQKYERKRLYKDYTN
jgi:hypothetical protein